MTRTYPTLLIRLQSALASNKDALTQIGTLHTSARAYPVVKIILGKGSPNKVLLAAGIHGDEPAGVESLYIFIKDKLYKRYINKCEITLLPCINPTGYEAGTRRNFNNIDLNRKFKLKRPPMEVRCAQSVFQDPFDMSIELHEDCESDGFYLYQAKDSNGETVLGYKILGAIKKIMPINTSDEIDGMPAVRGVIQVKPIPKKMKFWPMAIYSMTKGTSQYLTLETPSTLPLSKRIKAHLAALEISLDDYVSAL